MFDHLRAPFRQRAILLTLARTDFRSRYKGSLLGTAWAFAQPVLTILLYLFIYQVGFRGTAPHGVPFVLWLIVGMAPWFFLSDALVGMTGVFLEYAFLVKKVVFDAAVIPAMKLLAISFVHVVVWLLIVVIVLASGRSPTLTWLQIPYYFVALLALISGAGLFMAAITPLFRDMAHIVSVVLQFGFWLTPVMWPLSAAPENLRLLLQGNPLYYIIDGLRDAVFLDKPFWDKPLLTAYFWALVILMNAAAGLTFSRARSHFADVL